MKLYSWWGNIRIAGISYEENEDSAESAMKLASDIGVDLIKDDVNTSHRLGTTRDRNKTRPVIVRLTKRYKKIQLLKYKKRYWNWESSNLGWIRRGMFYKVRKYPNTTRTVEGKIYAIARGSSSEVKKVRHVMNSTRWDGTRENSKRSWSRGRNVPTSSLITQQLKLVFLLRYGV